MGRDGGVMSSLQSCALFGVASYFLEGMGKVAPAEAGREWSWAQTPDERRLARFLSGQTLDDDEPLSHGTLHRLLSPAMPLLAALKPCSGSDGCGGSVQLPRK